MKTDSSNKNKKKFNIILTSFFDTRHIKRDLLLHKKLESYGLKVLTVTNKKNIYNHFFNEKCDVFYTERKFFLPKILNVQTELYLREKYGLPSSLYKLVEVVFVQQSRIYYSREQVIQKFLNLLDLYEDLFKEKTSQFLFQQSSMDLERMALNYVAKRFKIETIEYTDVGFPGREYMRVLDHDFSIDKKNLTLNSSILGNDFIEKLKKTLIDKKKEGKYLRSASNFNSRNKNYPFYNKIKDSFSHRNFTKFLISKARTHIFVRLRAYITSFLYKDINYNDSYVFFPMHSNFESNTIYRGFTFREQFELVKSIALSLPQGIKLVVKEHPGYEGEYALYKFLELKKHKNIVIAKPKINSHKIILNAKACCVINSTVYFESLVFSVPVFAFGKGLFTGHDVVEEVYDLSNLDKSFYLLFSGKLKNRRNQIIKFLRLLYQKSKEHNYYYYVNGGTPLDGAKSLFSIIKEEMNLVKNETKCD